MLDVVSVVIGVSTGSGIMMGVVEVTALLDDVSVI